MSIEGLIALIGMLVVGLAGIGLPFLTTRSGGENTRKRQLEVSRDELIAAYERVLASLRDLEDDHKSGKMHPAEYEQEREHWAQYGVRLLQLLDGDTPTAEDVSHLENDHEMQLDRSVEEAIENYRLALQSVEKVQA